MSIFQRLLLFCALFAVWAATAAEPLCVVTGSAPSRLEKEALAELQTFWQQLYGKTLPVLSEADASGKAAIYLGDTAFSRDRLKTSPESYGKEEWCLKTVGDNLIITGGRPAGTLYGVYAVLERLGVRFCSWETTFVPKAPAEFPSFDERKKPAFDGRLIATRFPREILEEGADAATLEAYRRWLLRMRSNGQEYVHLSVYYKGDMNNITVVPQFHSLCSYVPVSLFKEHPEYFSMDSSGKRFAPFDSESGGSLCMSNPEVVRVAVDSMRKMIRHDRETLPQDQWPVLYDVSVLDATTFICLCPKCRAITQEEGSDTGLVIRFVNAISREITREYPEIRIRTMVYGPTNKPVFKTKPLPNIQFQVTDLFSTSDPFHGLAHPLNRKPKEYLENWNRAVDHLAIWDYGNIGLYFNPPRVECNFDALVADTRYFKSMKVESLFLEWERSHIAPQNFIDLGHYIAYRLMLDTEIDAEKEADEFIRDYYGPGAPLVRKYFKRIREGVLGDPRMQTTTTATTWSFMTPEFAAGMYQDFSREIAALPENSVYRTRLEREMIPLLWEVCAKESTYKKAFVALGITMPDLVKQCRALIERYINRFPSHNRNFCRELLKKNFSALENPVSVPPEFRHIPESDLRVLVAANEEEACNPGLGVSVQPDPEASVGKAIRSANVDQAYHGVAKILPGPHAFISTGFTWENFKKNSISVVITKIPPDEKYHWYKIPGKLTIGPQSYFWGQGWSISIPTHKVYMMTGDMEKDNTWECHFKVKFTGPAYVKGSTKENAIWLDMVVLSRPQEKQ